MGHAMEINSIALLGVRTPTVFIAIELYLTKTLPLDVSGIPQTYWKYWNLFVRAQSRRRYILH